MSSQIHRMMLYSVSENFSANRVFERPEQRDRPLDQSAACKKRCANLWRRRGDLSSLTLTTLTTSPLSTRLPSLPRIRVLLSRLHLGVSVPCQLRVFSSIFLVGDCLFLHFRPRTRCSFDPFPKRLAPPLCGPMPPQWFDSLLPCRFCRLGRLLNTLSPTPRWRGLRSAGSPCPLRSKPNCGCSCVIA